MVVTSHMCLLSTCSVGSPELRFAASAIYTTDIKNLV